MLHLDVLELQIYIRNLHNTSSCYKFASSGYVMKSKVTSIRLQDANMRTQVTNIGIQVKIMQPQVAVRCPRANSCYN